MRHTHDVLILGFGIAGSVLAETLSQRGLHVHVFDRKLPGNASMAAAGIVNPVVLKRDVPSWRAGELLSIAERFYTALGERLGRNVWHPIELVKLFATDRDAVQWERACSDPATAPFIDRRAQPSAEAAPVHATHGHGTVHRAAWLDVSAMLDAQRSELMRQGRFTEGEIGEAEIIPADDGVRIGSYSARWLVRCTGAFAALPGMVPVKGEGITVRLPGMPHDRLLHRGVFVLPAADGSHRIGATFRWDNVWDGPTEEAERWLLERLGKMTSTHPDVVERWSGVRPTSADRRPIMGRISAHEAVFNGLGSRGVLLAPWCAAHLADHLLMDRPIDPEVDRSRPL